MAAASPFAWYGAWADAFGAGLRGLSPAGDAHAILRAEAAGFRLIDAAGRSDFLPYTDDAAMAPAGMAAVTLRLTAPDGVIRPLTAPAAAARELADIANLNLARLSPIAPMQAAWAVGAVRRVADQVVADVHIAPRARLEALRDAALAKGFVIAGADIEDPAEPAAAASADLLGGNPSSQRWPAQMITALCLALLTAAAIGWLAPPPPGAAARAHAAEIAAAPPLTALLGAAAGALPDDAALTRMVRTRSGVRLEGEAANPESLIDLIDAAGPFRRARLAAPLERAPGATTARFVIEADLR